MFDVLVCAVKSVLTVLIAASAGIFLVRLKVLNSDSLRTISKVVFFVALPALLFTKVAQAIDLKTLKELWIFPVSAVVFIFTGCFLGRSACKMLGIKGDVKGLVMAASGLGNSGYLPIPLVVAICSIFPVFQGDSEASAKGITFISAYIMVFSPMLWIYGYNLLAGGEKHHLKLKYFSPPPIIGLICGLIIGLTPFLKSTFCTPEGMLYPIFAAGKIISLATIPLALIVLGGRFATPVSGIAVDNKAVYVVVAIKLLLLPSLALAYIFGLRHFGIIPLNPLVGLVLVVEAATPPANNLIVIASIHGKSEQATAKALFWCYVLCAITLTCFVALGMKLFS